MSSFLPFFLLSFLFLPFCFFNQLVYLHLNGTQTLGFSTCYLRNFHSQIIQHASFNGLLQKMIGSPLQVFDDGIFIPICKGKKTDLGSEFGLKRR